MIDPKELRIGNWVIFDGRHEQILGDISGPHGTYPESGNNLSPIPLTPEILEKCGFEVYKDNPYWKNPNYVFYHLTIGYESFPIAIVDGEIVKYFACEDDEYSWFGRPIISLHQLQNLYFALTGTELNYSPDNKINT